MSCWIWYHIAKMGYEYKLGNNDWVELRCIGKQKIYAVCCEYGGGDERYEDLIYTDNNGIDHLVYSSYESFHECQCFLDDKILGLHKLSPFVSSSDINSIGMECASDRIPMFQYSIK